MAETLKRIELRELIRQLERKLGILQESQQSCCGCISMAQCHALVEIGRAEKISLNDLSDKLNLDSSTMSRTVNKLVANDLVKRNIDPADRRYITISLTPKGESHFHSIESDRNSHFQKIYESIPVSKQKQVLESLQLLNEALTKNQEK